jgi:hypothetical protein
MEAREELFLNSRATDTISMRECSLIEALIEIKAVHEETLETCNCRVCQIARKALSGIIAHC